MEKKEVVSKGVNPSNYYKEAPSTLKELSPITIREADVQGGLVATNWETVAGIVREYGDSHRNSYLFLRGAVDADSLLERMRKDLDEEGRFPYFAVHPIGIRKAVDSRNQPYGGYIVNISGKSWGADRALEATIASKMGLKRSLSAARLLIDLGVVEEWWYNLDVHKLLEPLGITREESVGFAKSIVNEESLYQPDLEFISGGYRIPIGLSFGEITDLCVDNISYTRVQGSNIITAAWNTDAGEGEKVKILPLGLCLSLGRVESDAYFLQPDMADVLRNSRTELAKQIIENYGK